MQNMNKTQDFRIQKDQELAKLKKKHIYLKFKFLIFMRS